MIASLRGVVQSIGTDHAVVETGGIGLLVYAPRPVLDKLGGVGADVFLYTWLQVREDALTLYGFASLEQRALFEALIGVTRFGPKAALGLLSAGTPEEVRLAIARQDTAWLAKAPGVGQKTAERLILELKGKLKVKDLPPTASGTLAAAASPAVQSVNTELLDLLVSLGYSSAEASEAIASLPSDAPAELEERLRLALRYFGSA